MADDEMRFHMNSLAEECLRGGDCLPKQVVVIDPLVSAAWVDPAAFDYAEWAATHPEILADGLQAIGVFCIEAHWIPFLIAPWGNTVRIASFDAAQELPAMLSACLMRMTHGLGFTETFFDHVVRPFAIKSACGAVAINFLRAQLVGFPRLCSNVSAWEEHHCLRRRFMQHIGNSTEVPRPWFWGNGPPSGGNLGSESGLPGPASSSPSCATDVALGPAVSVGAPGSSAQVAQEVVDALACVPSDGLGALKGPTFMTSQQYAAVRSQMLASDDRRNLLAGQYGIWADDEIRFHLQALADQCNVVSNDQLVRHVRVVDPLITLSWTLQGSMSATDSARLFRFACTEQVILVGTLKVREHWVPFLLFPAGSRVRIVTGDYQAEIPAQWINCLIEFAFALGFQSLRFDHTRRDIRCRSACGAVAINFVGCQLGLSTEVTKYAAVWALHTEFRRVFTDALHESEFVSRPWIWASGQESDDASECSWPSEDQVPVNLPVAESTPVASQTDGGVPFAHQCISTDERIDLFAVHGRSMGDDEVRFHLATLIQKRASRSGGSDTHRPVVVPFECLNFLNWDDVGHILTEKWCESAKQVKSHGHQIAAVVLEGSHWLPLWAVPAGMVLVVHTFDDIVDYDIFDGKLRWIGLHLGFEEVVIHRLLPWFPPAESIAVPIFETVAIHVRLLEKQLMSTSRQYARLRRARNPNLIFRDIKGPSSHGVDFLIRPLQSNVTEVRADDCSVLVDPPQPWVSDRPVLAHGLPLNIIHVEDDCLWLQSIEGVQVGQCVSQLQCTGTKADLEKAFAEAWKARWDRHAHVPEDRWVTILSFARAFLPRLRLDWPQLTPDVLGQLIASKKSSSACGLDGVSIQDLKSMPPAALSNFCDMYSTAEQTGQWPSQLLMGKVVCLAKVDQPSSVLDYRPITILGTKKGPPLPN
ncbi:unnamed protein product [Cladocopium goreaui]|uniref:Uncharacterized protein n=1 Tax=Cladocopium goreaui TaxID=2562237 RepID=A0A9P1CX39_9DINO|nr:unnamed protein product [Cladocopium goreaui]